MRTIRRLASSAWIAILLLGTAVAQPTDPSAANPAAAPAAAAPASDPVATPFAGAPAPDPAAAPVAAAPGQPAEGGGLKAWVQSHPRSTRDAIAGGITGALLGGLFSRARGGSFLKGALIGAGVGSLAGYFVGKSQDKVQASRDEAVRAAAYDPSQSYLLRLEEIKAEPATATPAGQVTLSVRYLVISPHPQETITINCFRGIKYQGSYLNGDGPSSLVIHAGGGIVASSSTIKLPKEAPAGSYTLEEVIEDRDGRFQQSGTAPLYITAGS